MYRYERRILLRETDATGVVFFSELLNLSLEAMESYFFSCKLSLHRWLDQKSLALPVVHAEVDFFSPMKAGDEVVIELTCKKIGSTSFQLAFGVKGDADVLLGSSEIVHVCICQKTGKPISVPQSISAHLREL